MNIGINVKQHCLCSDIGSTGDLILGLYDMVLI